MTLYWDRCDLCGLHNPTKACTLAPDISVDVHCCVACPHWLNKCKNPAWKLELPVKTAITRVRSVSAEERRKLMEELTSLLEGKKA